MPVPHFVLVVLGGTQLPSCCPIPWEEAPNLRGPAPGRFVFVEQCKNLGQKGERQKERERKGILFQRKTVHFKHPFYYIICIVILIIDLAGSSNEAGEYKVSNKVNCCL